MHHRRRAAAAAASDDAGKIKMKRKAAAQQQQQQRDGPLFTALLSLLVVIAIYWFLVQLAETTVHKGYLAPLPKNASLDRFSEERAMEHVWYLADEIGIRQEGSEGLVQAAQYLKKELESLRSRSEGVRFEIDEQFVSGSFNMRFLKYSVGLTYRNHTNIAVRISAGDETDDKASVLVNGHFDSPLGSPGAGDCASCVASMLEVLRYIVDTKWKPPSPVIFLFNGAEEVFLVGSHGFITTHKWRSTIGAAINVEANGARGPDLVVQAGPETWPTSVYAQSAVVPIANSIAQDIFPLVPGDTDYRIFSQDFSDIPGLDIVFLLKGYVYHTAYDTPQNIVSGGLQARGENLIALVKGFAACKEMKTAPQREEAGGSKNKRHVFFDVFGISMVHYSRGTALVLHLAPLLAVFVAAHHAPKTFSRSTAFLAILEGAFLHFAGCVLALVFPIMLAVVKGLVSSTAMSWFSHPILAVIMFVLASAAGLLFPRAFWSPVSYSKDNEDDVTWVLHWGALGLYAAQAAVATFAGAMSAYFICWWAMFMVPALISLRTTQRLFGRYSIGSMFGYLVPALIPAAYSVFFGTVLVQFMAEKLGMVGTHPGLFGFLVGDVVMAAVVGISVVTSAGLIVPGVGHLMAKPRIVMVLLATAAAMTAFSSFMFPYSASAPKRVIVQHTFRTARDVLVDTTYDFATVDPNSMNFVFNHAPEVLQLLEEPKLSQHSSAITFLPLFPISVLLSRSVQVPAHPGKPYGEHQQFPKLIYLGSDGNGEGRKIHLELDTGSLREIWAAAINITGPLVKWSFCDERLPEPESVEGGPPSYVLRFSGHGHDNWNFWLESHSKAPLKVELGVLDQRLEAATSEMIQKFPSWAAVVAGTSYLSSYEF